MMTGWSSTHLDRIFIYHALKKWNMIANDVSVDLKLDDISTVHWLGAKNRTARKDPIIIMRMKERKKKTAMMKGKKT